MAIKKNPITGEKRKEVKARRKEVAKIPSKGITAKPAKMRDASPNFVETYASSGDTYYNDPGTNPGGSPKVQYKAAGMVNGRGRVQFQKMTNKGKFEYQYPKGYGKTGAGTESANTHWPRPMGGGKKGTKPTTKKATAASSKKASVTKKPMMKSTKK
jgi:hypothetical protein